MPSPPPTPAPLHVYRFHGVRVDSDIDLPVLAPWLETSDLPARPGAVRIRRGDLSRLPAMAERAYAISVAADDTHRLHLPEGATIIVRPDGEVVVDAAVGMPGDLLRHILVGQALPNALAHLGYLVLHASAVSVGGRAVAFFGDSGAGKSSTAVALVRRGHALVSDDALPITFEDGAPWSHPGAGMLKLWQETVDAFGVAAMTMGPTYAGITKLLARAPAIAERPLEVSRVYVLRRSQTQAAVDPLVRRVDGGACVTMLVANTFGHRRVTREGRERHFLLCAQLVASGVVRELVVPHDLRRLDEVIDVVIADADPVDARDR